MQQIITPCLFCIHVVSPLGSVSVSPGTQTMKTLPITCVRQGVVLTTCSNGTTMATNDAIYTINTMSTDSVLSINNIVGGLDHGGMYRLTHGS